MGPLTLVLAVTPPWSPWGAALRPVYLACVIAGHVLATTVAVMGRLRNRSTGRRAWSVLALALASITVVFAMEELLPPEALSTGLSGLIYVAATILVSLSVLAVPLLLVRARLNRTRDHEGLVDAIAIAVSVGLVLWDVLVLSGVAQHVDVLGTTLTAATGASATALMARLSFTGVQREASAILLLVAGVLMVVTTLLFVFATTSGQPVLEWASNVCQVIAVGCAAAAALHPSADRLSDAMEDPGLLGARLSVGRLVALAVALATPAAAAAARAAWPPVTATDGRPSLLPSALAGLVVTASVVWRMAYLVRDREEARELLQRRMLEDDLTGLPNRRGLYELLARRQAGCNADGTAAFAVQFIDLDGFKAINDTLGHAIGDMVLTEVAKRIRAALRPEDTVARLAGDEFVTICEGPLDAQLARHLADRIHQRVTAPIGVMGVEVAVSASIGVALPPPSSGDTLQDVQSIIRLADHAMYDAKRAGGGQTTLAATDDDGHRPATSSAPDAAGGTMTNRRRHR